jgi:RHS repeat-associated protein
MAMNKMPIQGNPVFRSDLFLKQDTRYYNPTVSVWLSVDPLAHKYPSMSSYVFTGNNPVLFVDPDGNSFIIAGNKEARNYTFNQLRKAMKREGIKLEMNDNGVLSYTLTKKNKTLSSPIEIFLHVIDNNKYEVTMTAQETNQGYGFVMNGGAFMGSEYDESTGIAKVNQRVNPYFFGAVEDILGNRGTFMLHEANEAASLAIMTSIFQEDIAPNSSHYHEAHSNRLLSTSHPDVLREFIDQFGNRHDDDPGIYGLEAKMIKWYVQDYNGVNQLVETLER